MVDLALAGGGTLAGNKVSGNKLDGLLIRDGADPEVLDNDASQNGGYGATLKVRLAQRNAGRIPLPACLAFRAHCI